MLPNINSAIKPGKVAVSSFILTPGEKPEMEDILPDNWDASVIEPLKHSELETIEKENNPGKRHVTNLNKHSKSDVPPPTFCNQTRSTYWI